MESVLAEPVAAARGAEGGGWRHAAWGAARVYVLWLSLGMFFLTRDFVWTVSGVVRASWAEVWWGSLTSILLKSTVWTVFTPALLYLCRRWPVTRGTWVRNAWPHVAAALVLAVAATSTDLWYMRTTPVGRGYGAPTFFLSYLHVDLLFYIFAAGAIHAIDAYRRTRAQTLANAALQARLSAAELEAMRVRLDPDLVFPVLESVRRLLRRDAEAADLLVSSFGDMLRGTLRTLDAPAVPLQDELESLEQYLEVKQAQYGDRLTVDVEADPAVLQALVPAFLLRHCVEGVLAPPAACPARVLVGVSTRRDGAHLVIEVAASPHAAANGADEKLRLRVGRLYAPGTWQVRAAPDGGQLTLAVPLVENDTQLWAGDDAEGARHAEWAGAAR